MVETLNVVPEITGQNVLVQQVLSVIHLSGVNAIETSANQIRVDKMLAVLILLVRMTANVTLGAPEILNSVANVHQ